MGKVQKDDLLRFLIEKNIPIQQAIEILQQEKEKSKSKPKAREKAVLSKYETR